MDSRIGPGAIVIALLALLLTLMYVGWKARQRRQAKLPRPRPVPDAPGARILTQNLFYVASTLADQPLNRIAVSGLGYRARASVIVFESGVALQIPGEPDAFLPAADITGVDRATWTIDRVVERDGLVRIAWRLGDTAIDSYLRVSEPADPVALISAIEGTIAGPIAGPALPRNGETT